MSPPALPNLTFTITPPGGSPTNYTTRLVYDGASQDMSISQNFGRQGDTANFVVLDEFSSTPNFYVPVESQVRLTDNLLSEVLFAGVVVKPTPTFTGPNRTEWVLNCTDYTYYADNAVVFGTFNNLTVDQIVVLLTNGSGSGITAAPTGLGGFVAPGPQLTQVQFNYVPLSSAWRTLAQLASQVTPYGWYVDENLHLHFYDASTAISSGATFTTTLTNAGLGSITEGHMKWDSNTYEFDGGTIHNKILVQGATQTVYMDTTKAPNDRWRADGTATAWPLRHTSAGANAQLSVNGATTKVVTVTNGSTSTAPWAIEQNSVGAWFLVAQSPPPAGYQIRLWYDYLLPIIVQAQDKVSQATYTGPNGGVFAEYVNDPSLYTVDMALGRAMRERTEYAYAVERCTFTSSPEFFGWVRSGQTFVYHNPFVNDTQNGNLFGVTDTFLAISNDVTFTSEGGYREMELTGVRI